MTSNDNMFDECIVCCSRLGEREIVTRFCCGGVYHLECADKYFASLGREKSAGKAQTQCALCRKKRVKLSVYFAGKITSRERTPGVDVAPRIFLNENEYYYTDTGVLDCEAVVAANGWQLQSGEVAAEPCGQTTAHANPTKYRDEYIRTRDDVLYTVAGPIQIYNDHVVSCCTRESEAIPAATVHGCKEVSSHVSMDRALVLKRCVSQIEQSDVLVATVDAALSCFGTFNEIGVAFASKKVVLVVLDRVDRRSIEQLWFLIHMSLASVASRPEVAETAFATIPYVRHWLGKSVDGYCKSLRELVPDSYEWSGAVPAPTPPR